jgi:hypothetical protein
MIDSPTARAASEEHRVRPRQPKFRQLREHGAKDALATEEDTAAVGAHERRISMAGQGAAVAILEKDAVEAAEVGIDGAVGAA